MLLRTLLASTLMAYSFVAVAGSLDANLNNDSARLGVTWNMNSSPNSLEGEFAAYYNTDDVYVGTLGVRVVGETGRRNNPLEAGVGGKIIAVTIQQDNADFDTIGAALGFGLRYYPAAINRLAFGLQLYYAPQIVTFGDAENIMESTFSIEYQVLPQAFAYVGYRRLDVTPEGGEEDDVDAGTHAGIRILFQ